MKNFELFTPVHVVFGPGEIKNTGKYAKEWGKTALLVSYDPADFFAPVIAQIKQSLADSGVEVIDFLKVQANPLLGHVKQAVQICREKSVDLVIGVGGGSVMDTAKTVAAGVLYEGEIWEMFISRHDREIAIAPKAALPIILIPSLPATSSEMNNIAVVTNEQTHEKAYFQSPVVYAKVAIMDPVLTTTLPPYQTACGAVDAISHVLEAYLNGDQNSPIHDRIQEGLVMGIMDELQYALQDPTNIEHRANLQWASTLCWNGWMQAGLNATTPMHQLGHVLSARYNTTHGVTLAIFMNAFFRYTANLNAERAHRFATLGKRIFNLSDAGMDDLALANAFVDRFVEFMKSVGVPTTLAEANIPESEIEAIADDVIAHGCDSNGNLPSIPPIGRDGIIATLKLAR